MEEKKTVEIKLNQERVLNILDQIQGAKVGVIGDACLDIYLDVDMRISELSRETPHYPLPVLRERIYLGGGTNVALNIKDLGVSNVHMLSIIGNDWRGQYLISKLRNAGIDTEFMIDSKDRITPAYCKPLRKGYSDLVYEDPRIDFENREPISDEDEKKVIEHLRMMVDKVDIIAVCDQFTYGIISKNIRDELGKIALSGKKVIVDSRSRIGLFKNLIIKPNDMEAMAAAYDGDLKEIDQNTVEDGAIKLYRRNKAPVIITMGDKGSIWYAGDNFYMAKVLPVTPPIDIVGAGDAFLGAFTSAYGAGVEGNEAIYFGNLVSSVVIQKIGMAGTATPVEVVKQVKEADI